MATTNDKLRTGDYYAVRWSGTSADETGQASPGFATAGEATKWVGRSENYVIRRKAADGWQEVEGKGVHS